MDHASPADTYVGSSPAARFVRAQLAAFAVSDATAIVTGQTGSGKEIAARAIHQGSRRRDRHFVAVDCGALNDSLAESELFGHVRGAFTGAVAPRDGLFVEAHGGTIFLDEVSNASPQLQARLLRVLETREVRPVGGNRARHVDVRVIAAASRDLAAEVRAGRFREDLLFRLDVLRVRLPALAERLDDIPELSATLLARMPGSSGGPACITDEALQVLTTLAWPGNVRQLRNVLERAAALARGGVIEAHDIETTDGHGPSPRRSPQDWRAWQAENERVFVLASLEASGWNRTATARALGISRQALYDRIRRHGLQPTLVAPVPQQPTMVVPFAPPARIGAG